MALGDGFESCLEAGEWLDTVEVASLDKVGNQTLRFGPTYLNSYDHFEGSKSLIYFTRICPLRAQGGHLSVFIGFCSRKLLKWGELHEDCALPDELHAF